jgi:ribose transport system permease protein
VIVIAVAVYSRRRLVARRERFTRTGADAVPVDATSEGGAR